MRTTPRKVSVLPTLLASARCGTCRHWYADWEIGEMQLGTCLHLEVETTRTSCCSEWRVTTIQRAVDDR